MIVVVIVLSLFMLLFAVWAAVASWYVVKFARTIFDLEDKITETGTDIEGTISEIDAACIVLDDALRLPVPTDDHMTRQIIDSVKTVRAALESAKETLGPEVLQEKE